MSYASPNYSSRKRSSSISSSPRPSKSARMALTRTESYLTLHTPQQRSKQVVVDATLVPFPSCADAHSPHPPLRQKAPRERRPRSIRRPDVPASIAAHVPSRPPPATPPLPQLTPTSPRQLVPRPSSPLVPVRKRTPLPPRASYPPGRREPDLYKVAITTRMRHSPHGQKILLLGARRAAALLAATMELEQMVAAKCDDDEMVVDSPTPPENAWIFVPGEDWEIVDRQMA